MNVDEIKAKTEIIRNALNTDPDKDPHVNLMILAFLDLFEGMCINQSNATYFLENIEIQLRNR